MRKKNYAVTETAYADMREIADYYSAYSATYVAKLGRSLRSCFQRVGAQPKSGKACDHLSPGLRSVVVDRRYLVFFRREGRKTNIVRVIDGIRNITAAFFNPDPPADDE